MNYKGYIVRLIIQLIYFDFKKHNGYQWASEWYELAGKLVEKGLLRPHPIPVQPGGWEGIVEGIEQLGCGQLRRKKLVYAVGK